MAQLNLGLCVVLLLAAAFSSFTLINAEDSSKSEEHTDKDASLSDDSSSQEDSKAKRSQEEIMFGNQQNQPNGLVDDLMGMADSADDDTNDSMKSPDKKSNASKVDEQSIEDSSKEDKGEKRSSHHGEEENDMMMGSGSENWYNTVPVSASALQYLANSPTLQTLPSEAFNNGLYDQEDLYRRKRQLMGQPLRVSKRSLRRSLGQMIQKRGLRMPRRSMRLKRQVDVEDLLSYLGKDRYFDDQAAVDQQSLEGWDKRMDKRHVPGRFSSYPEVPTPEFRYPYVFQHRDNSLLAPENEFEESNNDVLDEGTMDDIDDLMLLPPNSRYVETPDVGVSPFRTREEENEAIQKWLARHTTPSVFTVTRRSSPTFYPLDYRFIPAPYKKRSVFSHGNRMGNRFSGEEEQDTDFGKWGHVVQVPEAYASAEDVARLYGLANLMAEGDDSEAKMRRSV